MDIWEAAAVGHRAFLVEYVGEGGNVNLVNELGGLSCVVCVTLIDEFEACWALYIDEFTAVSALCGRVDACV